MRAGDRRDDGQPEADVPPRTAAVVPAERLDEHSYNLIRHDRAGVLGHERVFVDDTADEHTRFVVLDDVVDGVNEELGGLRRQGLGLVCAVVAESAAHG